jgi:hypothetical protein
MCTVVLWLASYSLAGAYQCFKGDKFFQNAGNRLQDYTVSYLSRPISSSYCISLLEFQQMLYDSYLLQKAAYNSTSMCNCKQT